MMATCPVCDQKARRWINLPAAEIVKRLAGHGIEMPQAFVDDYVMQGCQTCGLKFANPMQPGNDAFYDRLIAEQGYYPGERWEWPLIKDRLGQMPDDQLVLDIGCGDGSLLSYLQDSHPGRYLGLDLSAEAVARCHAKGVEARQVGLTDFLAERQCDAKDGGESGADNTTAAAPVGAVLMTHVLEHVPDPVGIMMDAKGLLAPGGCIMVSVPWSPRVREAAILDPLNLPPHHLTRWNDRAMSALANRLDMTLTLTIEGTESLERRVRRHLAVRWLGEAIIGRREALRLAIRHPFSFLNALARQAARRPVDGKIPGDVMLAIFKRKMD